MQAFFSDAYEALLTSEFSVAIVNAVELRLVFGNL